MPRSRTTIEAEIAALQAELAKTQPDYIKVEGTRFGGRPVSLRAAERGDLHLRFYWYDSDTGRERRPDAYFKASEAGQLRDWLNYHFPKKENA